MANLSITSVCNRRCSYCFTPQRQRADGSAGMHMAEQTFLSALDFLQRSGLTQVRLLGGEPTLHPRIRRFLEEILKRGLSVQVFSNGLMPERVVDYLERNEGGRISLIINASATAGLAEEVKRQRAVLKRLRGKAMLGVNITSPAACLSSLLDWTLEFELSPFIRLGLAHPCYGGENLYLHPGKYAAVGDRLLEFREKASRHGVSLRYDCGFVPCLFSGSQPKMLKQILTEAQFVCSPIPDILPDGSLVPCYPLGLSFREGQIPADGRAAEVRARFADRLLPFRSPGIYPECGSCPFRRSGVCPGGCLAASLKRLRSKKNFSYPVASRISNSYNSFDF